MWYYLLLPSYFKKNSKFAPYKLVYGHTIKSEIYSFTTASKEQDSVSLLILNDIHDRPATIPHLTKLATIKKLYFDKKLHGCRI